MADKWLVLAAFGFDSRTTRISKGQVVHPSYTYEARLLSAGYIDRSISVPSGLYQGSDAVIEIAETDRALRDFLAHETPLRRLFSMRIMPAGGSQAAYDEFGTFEILDAEFEAGKCRITGRDITFSWIDKKIPGLINRTNFPTLMDGVDEAFLPIIQGINESDPVSSPPNPQGVLRLPRMTLRRWGLAQTPIVSVVVFRMLPGDGEYSVVNAADYVVTEEAHTFDGIDYTLSFLDFDVDQDPGAEVRVDAHGIDFRGQFGTMVPVSPSPPAAIRNPVDFLINMLFGLLSNETRTPRYNIASFDAVRTILESIITASPAEGYLCDGCITEPLTAGEFLGRFLTSFELDLFVNRFGELTLGITVATDPLRPVFSDGPVFGAVTDNSLILMNSVRQRLANPHVNRLRYNFSPNFATGEWAHKEVYNNVQDQLALGGSLSPAIPDIQEGILDMWFVRDPATAVHVFTRRMDYLALGSYRIEFNLPLPEVFDDLELAKLIGVTHYGGLETGGFNNAEFKTTGLTYDLDQLMCTVRGVLRVPQSIGVGCTSWNTPASWVSLEAGVPLSPLGTFNAVVSISATANFIFIGISKGTSTTSVFASMPRSTGVWQYHSVPVSMESTGQIYAADDNTIYIGSSVPGVSKAYRFDKLIGTPMTDLAIPDNNTDQCSAYGSPSNSDYVYWYTQATLGGGGSGAVLWMYRRSTEVWTKIGGTALNLSWNASDQNQLVSAVAEGVGCVYVAIGGGTIGKGQVWRGTPEIFPTSWTKIAGDGENSGWDAASMALRQVGLCFHDGILYAGLDGAASGVAQVWRWNGVSWLQIAGGGLNGGFTGLTGAHGLAAYENYLSIGTSGGSDGDAEVWVADIDNGYQMVKSAGDGINGSWTGRRRAPELHTDAHVAGNLFIGIGNLVNTGEIYQTEFECAD